MLKNFIPTAKNLVNPLGKGYGIRKQLKSRSMSTGNQLSGGNTQPVFTNTRGLSTLIRDNRDNSNQQFIQNAVTNHCGKNLSRLFASDKQNSNKQNSNKQNGSQGSNCYCNQRVQRPISYTAAAAVAIGLGLYTFGFASSWMDWPDADSSNLANTCDYEEQMQSLQQPRIRSNRANAIAHLNSFEEGTIAEVMRGPVKLLHWMMGEQGAATIDEHYAEEDSIKLMREKVTKAGIKEMAIRETEEYWQSGTEAEKEERFLGSLMPWQGRYIVLMGSYHALKMKKAQKAKQNSGI